MTEEKLRLEFIPSLVSVLYCHEADKGSPLAEEEVLAIRDSAEVIAVPESIAHVFVETRGYEDLDPEDCWYAWQRARVDLGLVDRLVSGAKKHVPGFEDLLALLGTTRGEELSAKLHAVTSHEPEAGTSDSEFPNLGFAFQSDASGRVSTIFIHSEGRDGYTGYKQPLIAGLSWSATSADVSEALGSPSISRPPAPGIHGGWCRYDYDTRSIHFSFAPETGTLELVTLMRPDKTPAR
ncbi:hypothetical protein ACFL59_03525 [Planctomycetota bacterium]